MIEVDLVFGDVAATRKWNDNHSDSEARHLETLSELRIISWTGDQLSGDAAQHLSKAQKLEYISAYDSQFGDDEVRNLAWLTNLRQVRLWTVGRTDASLLHLAGMSQLKELGDATAFRHAVHFERSPKRLHWANERIKSRRVFNSTRYVNETYPLVFTNGNVVGMAFGFRHGNQLLRRSPVDDG